MAEISVAALEDLLYLVDDPSGTPVSNKVSANRLGGLLTRAAFGYRLTTESGVPVSTSDRTSQSTIYLTPDPASQFCRLISLYDGTRWKLYTNAEISLALSGLTSGKNYDVFVYDNAGTLTLELSAAWTNDTTRADALTTQDGVYVKSGATTRRWVGTIRTTSTTATEDSAGGSTTQVGGKRFVWNYYNRVPRHLAVIDTTDNWSYATDTIRQADGASGNKVEYVSGAADTFALAQALGLIYAVGQSTRAQKVGVGVDSTTTFSGNVQGGFNAGGTGLYAPCTGTYSGCPGLGYHYLAWLEKGGDGTSVFLGDNGADGQQAGLRAWIMG